jgi:sialate O-acetylesterase
VEPALLLLLILIPAALSSVGVRLAPILTDHTIFPCEWPFPIWVWGNPHESVPATFDVNTTRKCADYSDGKWPVKQPAMPSDGPHKMTVARGETIRLNDILVGEVWGCSGQSSMARPVNDEGWNHVLNGALEAAGPDYPRICLLILPWSPQFASQENELVSAIRWVELPMGVCWDRFLFKKVS